MGVDNCVVNFQVYLGYYSSYGGSYKEMLLIDANNFYGKTYTDNNNGIKYVIGRCTLSDVNDGNDDDGATPTHLYWNLQCNISKA